MIAQKTDRKEALRDLMWAVISSREFAENHRLEERNAMIMRRGCLTGTEEEFRRRDFIKVGSLGFLGIHLSQALRLEAAMAQRDKARWQG